MLASLSCILTSFFEGVVAEVQAVDEQLAKEVTLIASILDRFGSNMNPTVFGPTSGRNRKVNPNASCTGKVPGWALRFNLKVPLLMLWS